MDANSRSAERIRSRRWPPSREARIMEAVRALRAALSLAAVAATPAGRVVVVPSSSPTPSPQSANIRAARPTANAASACCAGNPRVCCRSSRSAFTACFSASTWRRCRDACTTATPSACAYSAVPSAYTLVSSGAIKASPNPSCIA
ncbi:hypothetical protein Vafri_4098 [Volvox africanus]|uniref:Uncharacterized protein n=1 Tax=Volvox africanus TaxID=51714 RepID=A0A8J4AUC5_9CHLO|nr:hypothetical protein Vafri_4098 [Volvox africanus]